jgi:cbb3-type cytochrome oxidase subunit 3
MNSQFIRNFWLALMFCFIGLGYYLYKQKKSVESEQFILEQQELLLNEGEE